jgi:tRNA-splicing endonuclease subunit Sen54
MADADEDSSFLRAPDAADVDLTEETQDFRFLDKLTWVSCFAALLGLQD